MTLLRVITLQSMIDNVRFYAKFIKTKENGRADTLSRGKLDLFVQLSKEHNQTINQFPTLVPQFLKDINNFWLNSQCSLAIFAGKKTSSVTHNSSSSNLSRISSNNMRRILDRLKSQRNRDSTRANYHTVWKLFNKFLLQLNLIPSNWEDRIYLFMAYLVNSGKKSTTVRSYFSAIKAVLWEDRYELQTDDIQLRVITKACRLSNDKLCTRFPIKIQLLHLILLELEREYHSQYFLKILFQALFSIAYYGLFRIGELVQGDHTVKACDVHVAQNKDKVLFLLHSSKTHDESSRPQKIKISALNHKTYQ